MLDRLVPRFLVCKMFFSNEFHEENNKKRPEDARYLANGGDEEEDMMWIGSECGNKSDNAHVHVRQGLTWYTDDTMKGPITCHGECPPPAAAV